MHILLDGTRSDGIHVLKCCCNIMVKCWWWICVWSRRGWRSLRWTLDGRMHSKIHNYSMSTSPNLSTTSHYHPSNSWTLFQHQNAIIPKWLEHHQPTQYHPTRVSTWFQQLPSISTSCRHHVNIISTSFQHHWPSRHNPNIMHPESQPKPPSFLIATCTHHVSTPSPH